MRWNLKKVQLFAGHLPEAFYNGKFWTHYCFAVHRTGGVPSYPHCHGCLALKPFTAQHAALRCPNPRVFVMVVLLFRTSDHPRM